MAFDNLNHPLMHFSNTGGPKEKRLKYEMFMSGTLLQDVVDSHKQSRMKIDEVSYGWYM
jgi:hypothetical protein